MKKETFNKQARYARRKARVRAKLSGTAEMPRLSVKRSLKHISCQLIDDVAGKTLAAVSDTSIKATGKKSDKAKAVGTAMAEAAKKQGITKIVFDRSGFAYHGRIQALADAAREGGLKF